jgi:3-hydroxybutyryl-CoA dehydrogenase
VTRVAIVGTGVMGRGIAHAAAVAGYDVTLFDVNADVSSRALTQIAAALDSGVARGKLSIPDAADSLRRVFTSTELDTAVRNAEIVIEAAPEQLALKQDLFRRISAASSRTALLATNTSSLSVTAIAAVTDCAERVVGMHFFNPVAAMKLVEIVRGSDSGDDSVQRATAFAGSLKKTAIVVGDSPGFATSRLGVVLGLEAMRMLEQGVASASDIDTAMELGYNHPVGPLRLTDIVGLDVRLAVAERLYGAFKDSRYEPPAILRQMVEKGDLGKKSGQGFYNWPAEA